MVSELRPKRTMPLTKRCPRCDRWLRVVLGQTFNRNRSSVSSDGLQLLCRECDERRKATEIAYGYKALLRAIAREGTAREWSEDAYRALVEPDVCHWCKGRLSDWGKGHKIDRIDSMHPHVPWNAVACCSACNWSKGSSNPESWQRTALAPLLLSYGPGKIPWEAVDPKGPKRVRIPDLRPYVVEVQLRLGGV